ncbi:MAG: hypothetical protein FJX91_03465 [Bacteroidetes bacterium]|nr:hypothetical protein [Bacteroidota bacterium]
MILYPFKTQFLKTSLNRQQVSQNLIKETFLSDADFKKSDDQQISFFGEVSDQDFTLETITQNKPLVNFCNGEIRGSDNEIYILLQFGAWQHRRIFLLFALLILACFSFLANHLILYKAFYPQTMAAWLLLITFIALSATLIAKAKKFRQNTTPTINHFCKLWQAQAISKDKVPLIFQ